MKGIFQEFSALTVNIGTVGVFYISGNLLPFHIIKAASEGDVEAIQTVLKHYEGYIVKLSTRKMYDEFGQTNYCVDETLRRRLETKLIAKTLVFRSVPYKDIGA